MPIHFGSLIEVHLHKSRNHINSWSKSAMRLPLICVYHLISKWETFNVVEIDKKKSLAWNLISKTRIHSLNRATIRAGFVRFSLAHKLMPFMRIETSFFNYLNAKNNQIYIKWISFFFDTLQNETKYILWKWALCLNIYWKKNAIGNFRMEKYLLLELASQVL